MRKLLLVVLLACAAPASAAPTPEATFMDFAEAWLVRQDIDAAVSQIDLPQLGAALQKEHGRPVAAEAHARKWLTMWLIRDHGSVNSLGHGDPKHSGYASLPSSPSQVADKVSYASVNQAIRGLKYGEMSDDKGVPYPVAFFQIPHAPRDGVIVVMVKTAGGYKILGFASMAG